MYYAVNFIPLIFGNKQTIEFRIHTPTYNIHKIINFLLINIYLIDFTINNIDKILGDPKFIQNYDNIRYFIESYLKNSKTKLKKEELYDLIDYHNDYLSLRLKKVEEFNSKGDIEGNEEHIPCNKYIEWNSVDSNISKVKGFVYKPKRNSYKPVKEFAEKESERKVYDESIPMPRFKTSSLKQKINFQSEPQRSIGKRISSISPINSLGNYGIDLSFEKQTKKEYKEQVNNVTKHIDKVLIKNQKIGLVEQMREKPLGKESFMDTFDSFWFDVNSNSVKTSERYNSINSINNESIKE